MSIGSGWELHFVISGPIGEPQVFALGSRGIGEVDSDLLPSSDLLTPGANASGLL